MDHVLKHMEQRFPKQIKGVMTLSYLVPNKLHLITSELIEQWQSEFKYELTETGSELEQEVFNFFEISKCNANFEKNIVFEVIKKCLDKSIFSVFVEYYK